MIKLIKITLLFLVSMTSDAAEIIPSEFLGKWKSDSVLTLESMRKSKTVNKTERDFLKEGVFGQQVFEFKENSYATYFDGDKIPHNLLEYNIAESGANYVALVSQSSELNIEIKQTWYIEGDLIYTLVQEFGFKEYYRKIK